jgi:hypothetical protein
MHLLYYIHYRKNQLKVFEQLYQSFMLIFDVTLLSTRSSGLTQATRAPMSVPYPIGLMLFDSCKCLHRDVRR